MYTKTHKMKTTVINLLLLDESASMTSISEQILHGFNELIKTINKTAKEFPDQEHLLAFFTFNSNGIKKLVDFMPTGKFEGLEFKNYNPDGMTPLYDAMGEVINKTLKFTKKLGEFRVLMTTLTDGMENCSVKYSGGAIGELVGSLKVKGWTFTYIGANHDVESVAVSLQITNYISFETTHEGVADYFKTEQYSRRRYMQRINDNKVNDEDYFEKGD